MSFLDQCYVFSNSLGNPLENVSMDNTSPETLKPTRKQDDDATVRTESSEDPVVLEQKATEIQAYARGMIVRRRLHTLEQLAMVQTRARASPPINSESRSEFSIEHNIRSVRELLKSNNSVWSRCKSGLTGENKEGVRTFSRIAFVTVYAVTEGGKVTFSSTGEQSEKLFDMHTLEVLPENLGGIFEVKTDEFGFICYEAFLEKTLLLHEDVLGPFLVKLKDHLVEIKEVINEIDTWLAEPSIGLDFLQSTFNLGEDFKATTEPITFKEYVLPENIQVKGSFQLNDSRDQEMMKNMLHFVSS